MQFGISVSWSACFSPYRLLAKAEIHTGCSDVFAFKQRFGEAVQTSPQLALSKVSFFAVFRASAKKTYQRVS